MIVWVLLSSTSFLLLREEVGGALVQMQCILKSNLVLTSIVN